MGVTKIRCFTQLAAGMLIVSCTQHRGVAPPPLPAPRTITFHNNGRDRVQVYLIGEKDNWLLGRLEPLETAHLRLPESSIAEMGDVVVLAVLPSWARSLAPRSDRRVALSITEHTVDLPGEEWIFVNNQLQGPRQRH